MYENVLIFLSFFPFREGEVARMHGGLEVDIWLMLFLTAIHIREPDLVETNLKRRYVRVY